MGRRYGTDVEYVLERSIPEPNSGCWLWLNFVGLNGYGQGYINGKKVNAHVVSYVTFKGAVPEGLEIDHLCRTRCCVNPEHLEAVTHKVNAYRGTSPWVFNAQKYFCKNGHAFTEANTYKRPDGRRQCRACVKDRMRTRRKKLKCPIS